MSVAGSKTNKIDFNEMDSEEEADDYEEQIKVDSQLDSQLVRQLDTNKNKNYK